MCVCVSVNNMYNQFPMEAKRGCQIRWNGSYRELWAAMQGLGLEPLSSRRAAT